MGVALKNVDKIIDSNNNELTIADAVGSAGLVNNGVMTNVDKIIDSSGNELVIADAIRGGGATGGTKVEAADGYTYHTFTASDTTGLEVSGTLNIEMLLIAGGGGGAYTGGGGAGGVLFQT